MSKNRRLIPFAMLPASWGLKGKSRKIAEIEYYYTGYERDVKIAEVEAHDEHDKMLRLLEIDFKYNKIPLKEYKEKRAKLTLSGKELELELLKIQHSYKEITDTEYEKRLATINNEPWVKVVSVEADGSFEFDWNDQFIEHLEKAGFGPAPKPEMIVDEWFVAVCKSVTLEQVGNDLQLIEEQAEQRKNEGMTQSKKTPDGKQEFK